MARIEGVVIRLDAESKALQQELTRVSRRVDRFEREGRRSFRRFGDDAQRSFDGIKRAATAALGVLSVGVIFQATRAFAAQSAELGRLAASAALTVEEYQRLEFAFRQFGGDADQVSEAVVRATMVTLEAARGTKGWVDALSDIGLQYRELERLRPDAQFHAIRDAISRVADEGRRLALVDEIFGGELAEKVGGLFAAPEGQLRTMGDHLEEIGGVLDGEVVKAGVRVQRQFENISQVIRTQFVTGLVGAVDATNDLDESVGELGATFEGLGQVVGTVLTRLTQIPSAVQTALDALGTGQSGGSAQGDAGNLFDAVLDNSAILRAIFGPSDRSRRTPTPGERGDSAQGDAGNLFDAVLDNSAILQAIFGPSDAVLNNSAILRAIFGPSDAVLDNSAILRAIFGPSDRSRRTPTPGERGDGVIPDIDLFDAPAGTGPFVPRPGDTAPGVPDGSQSDPVNVAIQPGSISSEILAGLRAGPDGARSRIDTLLAGVGEDTEALFPDALSSRRIGPRVEEETEGLADTFAGSLAGSFTHALNTAIYTGRFSWKGLVAGLAATFTQSINELALEFLFEQGKKLFSNLFRSVLGAGGGAGGVPVGHDGLLIPGPRGAEVPIIAQAGELLLNTAQQTNLAGALAGMGGSIMVEQNNYGEFDNQMRLSMFRNAEELAETINNVNQERGRGGG